MDLFGGDEPGADPGLPEWKRRGAFCRSATRGGVSLDRTDAGTAWVCEVGQAGKRAGAAVRDPHDGAESSTGNTTDSELCRHRSRASGELSTPEVCIPLPVKRSLQQYAPNNFRPTARCRLFRMPNWGMRRAFAIVIFLSAVPVFGSDVQLLFSLPSGAVPKSIQLDAAGNIYAYGFVQPQTPKSRNGTRDAFVAKLSPDGSQVVYFTVLSGSLDDSANGLVLGSDGSAYVVGSTLWKPKIRRRWRRSSVGPLESTRSYRVIV